MSRSTVHILRENGRKEPPFATFTFCGIDLRILENTPAYWPADPKQLNERWCAMCRANAKVLGRERMENLAALGIRLVPASRNARSVEVKE